MAENLLKALPSHQVFHINTVPKLQLLSEAAVCLFDHDINNNF